MSDFLTERGQRESALTPTLGDRRLLIQHWQQRLEDITNRYFEDKDWNQFLLAAHLVRERLAGLRRGAAPRQAVPVTARQPKPPPKIVPVEFTPAGRGRVRPPELYTTTVPVHGNVS